MLGLEEYSMAFKKGLYYVLYGSIESIENVISPDYSNLESIGYYDGYQYGEYCERVGLSMALNQEQLLAVIDKYHTKALQRYYSYQDQYIRYKSGFIDGKFSILEKIHNEDPSFRILPEMDSNEMTSIGFYDGYSYFLNEFVKNGIVNRQLSIGKIDEILKSCFQKRFDPIQQVKENMKSDGKYLSKTNQSNH